MHWGRYAPHRRQAGSHRLGVGLSFTQPLWEQLSCGACSGLIAGKPAPTGAALDLEAT